MKKGADGYYRHDVWYDGKAYAVRSKSVKELWKKVAQKEQQLQSGQIISNGNTLVGNWLYDYIETYKKASITADTYHQLCAYVKNYIAPMIGRLRMKDVRAIDLQRVLNTCEGQSVSQANKLRNLIRGAFRQARINKIIPEDPAEALFMPGTESGTHRAITDFERGHILRLCESHRAGLWVLLMLYCGLRPAETRTLMWQDVDFENRVLLVQSAKNDYGVRRVPVPTPLFNRLFHAHQQASAPYVVSQPTTGHMHTKTSMRQMWSSFKRALDIQMGAQTFRSAIIPETSVVAKDLTPYCLRHTYGTDLQTAGIPINVAKDLMGHKDIAVTARIYTHLSAQSFADAAAQIEALTAASNEQKLLPFQARQHVT